MTSMIRSALSIATLLFTAQLVSACGDENSSLGGGSQAACQGQNWRQPTPASVTCPGATDCSCPMPQVCCIEVVNNKAVGAGCSELTQCAGPALKCDGSEDCANGEVCCLLDGMGGGSECRAPQDCFFSTEIQTCRDEAECDGLEHCEPSHPGSLYAGLLAGCVL
jgi:hypothetical protein